MTNRCNVREFLGRLLEFRAFDKFVEGFMRGDVFQSSRRLEEFSVIRDEVNMFLIPKLSDCLDSRAVRGDLTTEDENCAAAGSVGQCKWSEVWIAGQVSARSDGL
jgi:hypothetical protein